MAIWALLPDSQYYYSQKNKRLRKWRQRRRQRQWQGDVLNLRLC